MGCHAGHNFHICSLLAFQPRPPNKKGQKGISIAGGVAIEIIYSYFQEPALHLSVKLHQLKAFLLTLETGSFSEAALELGISQASVSYAVAELEKELGVKLLARGRSGVTPTAIGHEVAGQARVIFQAYGAIEQSVALDQGELKGHLRVATYPSISSKLMPKLFGPLRKEYPQLELSLEVVNDNAKLEAALREGKVDVALLLNTMSDDFIGWQVLHDPFVAVVPDSFGFLGERVSPDDLRSWPIILQRGSQCALKIEAYFTELGVSAQAKSYVNEGAPLMNEGAIMANMVAQGLGVALVASMLVDRTPDGVQLVRLEKSLTRTLLATILPSSLKIPAVRVFLNELKTMYPNSDVPKLEPNPKKAAA